MALTKEQLQRYRDELANDVAKTSSSNRAKFPYLKLKRNVVNRVRVLPGQEFGSIDKDWYVAVKQHANIQANNYASVTCPKNLDPSAECPVCTRVDKLFKSKNENDKTVAKRIMAKPRYFIGVVPLDGDDAGKIMIWGAPKKVKNILMSFMLDPDIGNFTDLVNGYDLKVTVTGENPQVEYTIMPVQKQSPITDNADELRTILDSQPPLYKLRRAGSVDDIRSFMSGEAEYVTQGMALADDEEEEKVPFESVPATTSSTEDDEEAETAFVEAMQAKATPAVNVEAPARPKFDIAAIQAQVKKVGRK